MRLDCIDKVSITKNSPVPLDTAGCFFLCAIYIMKAKRYSAEFKSSIVALYNDERSANSLANEYHLDVQTRHGLGEKNQIIETDVTGKLVTRAQFNAI